MQSLKKSFAHSIIYQTGSKSLELTHSHLVMQSVTIYINFFLLKLIKANN